MKFLFLFSQLFIIISSISVPSFTITQIDFPHAYCNYSTVNYHFGFIGNIHTNLTKKIYFEFELAEPSGYIAECSVDPTSEIPVVIYCIVDGYKYDVSHVHDIFLPLEDPSSNEFKFENWNEIVTSSTNNIVHDTNCPYKKVDYAFTFKSSPIKLLGCNGNKTKFSISCTRFNDISEEDDTKLNVYLYFNEPIHRRANCSVDLHSKDTSFNCEIEIYAPKLSIKLNSLSGDEINDNSTNLKHVHIRGDEVIQTTFDKCEDNSNSSSYNYFISINLYILGFLLLFLF